MANNKDAATITRRIVLLIMLRDERGEEAGGGIFHRIHEILTKFRKEGAGGLFTGTLIQVANHAAFDEVEAGDLVNLVSCVFVFVMHDGGLSVFGDLQGVNLAFQFLDSAAGKEVAAGGHGVAAESGDGIGEVGGFHELLFL